MIWVSSPFLKIRITLALFIDSGKTPVLKDIFIMLQRGSLIIFLVSFRIFVGILLGPVDLLFFKLDIKFSTSLGVVG